MKCSFHVISAHHAKLLYSCVYTCSFAIVTQQLPSELRDPVCIFYLVLRALDTVEDDMAIPAPDKLPTLISFHEKIYDRFKAQTALLAFPAGA